MNYWMYSQIKGPRFTHKYTYINIYGQVHVHPTSHRDTPQLHRPPLKGLDNPEPWPTQLVALDQLFKTHPLAGWGLVWAGMCQVSCWIIKNEGGILSALEEEQSKEIGPCGLEAAEPLPEFILFSFTPHIPTQPISHSSHVLYNWVWLNQTLCGS